MRSNPGQRGSPAHALSTSRREQLSAGGRRLGAARAEWVQGLAPRGGAALLKLEQASLPTRPSRVWTSMPGVDGLRWQLRSKTHPSLGGWRWGQIISPRWGKEPRTPQELQPPHTSPSVGFPSSWAFCDPLCPASL